MSNPNPTTQAGCTAPTGRCAESDASCRLPVLKLFLGAAIWLVVSSVLALIASIKFHKPDFMGDCPWFTYSHVHAAHLNAFAYGFAAQAGLGVSLWLLARTGKTQLALPGASFIAAILWNLAVLVGVGGIMAGNGTGFAYFEFPQAASVMLFIAYLVLALAGVLTFKQRRSDEGGSRCIAQVFILTALFWFPWVYAVAAMLLGCTPVRGVAQAVVAWWFAANFTGVWLVLIAIGALLHFTVKLGGRPLFSRPLALFSLGLILTFGSLAGVPSGAPVPAWLPALSTFATGMVVLAFAALWYNLHLTLKGCVRKECDVAGKFFCKALPWLGASSICAFIVASPIGSERLAFTWFVSAVNYALLYGFIGLVLLGAIYHIAPRLTGSEYCCVNHIKFHFWAALIGTFLLVLGLGFAGWKHGQLLHDSGLPFADTLKEPMKCFRISTLGDFLFLAGSVALPLSLVGLIRNACKACCSKKAEVKP